MRTCVVSVRTTTVTQYVANVWKDVKMVSDLNMTVTGLALMVTGGPTVYMCVVTVEVMELTKYAEKQMEYV